METKNWKWFRYDEVFDIKKGFYNKKPDENPYGEIPFIGATDSNNGITSMHDIDTIEKSSKTGEEPNADLSEKIFDANCITVSNNGSIGYAFYQSKTFTCTHDVNPLYLKNHELNPYIAMFLCSLIEKEQYRWAYGRKWRPIRMPSSLIKLPVTPTDTPDWQFMENYVKEELIPKLPKKAKSVWQKQVDKTPLSNKKLELKVEEWKWFNYQEIFQVTGSKTTPKLELEESGIGQFPYVTTQARNNGIEGFFNLQTEKGKVFTVDSAVLGFCAYQEKNFSASDHIEKLIPKFDCNIYIAMFITTLINKEQYRYNYGRKCSQKKLKISQILLPAIKNSQGKDEPDWQFMENFIKSLPYSRCL